MRRRRFIALAGAALAAPGRIAAAQPALPPTIGFLGTASRTAWQRSTAAFVDRLGELGWREGGTIRIEYRWTEGRSDAIAAFIDEFVRLKVDLIVTSGPAGLPAKRATSSIPIVLAVASDPVGTGLVESLSRPGGNLTALSLQANDVARKRVELLRELMPGLRVLAVVTHLDNPTAVREMAEAEVAAQAFGVEAVRVEIRSTDDVPSRVATVAGRCDALYVCTDPLLNTHRAGIGGAALAVRLPTVWGFGEAVVTGGLLSYGASFPNMFRRAAEYADRILRGAKAGDLPVEQPTQFELIVNLATARALGIAVPPSLLARADEVIE